MLLLSCRARLLADPVFKGLACGICIVMDSSTATTILGKATHVQAQRIEGPPSAAAGRQLRLGAGRDHLLDRFQERGEFGSLAGTQVADDGPPAARGLDQAAVLLDEVTDACLVDGVPAPRTGHGTVGA